ncbi:MAG: nucleoside 2-deoxyribosyltransferase domain-containing protein, partial [Planctomycetes bacterium]|nr:nucleoside 2-deoxyribosyltransferase domain-containing protein [Planctomycetota bacterium]
MRHERPPLPIDDAWERPWVFLAGAIDQDRAERWQDQACNALGDLPGTVLNPRRDAWDANWGQDLDDARFAGQVAWELDALDRADVVACWLPAGSQAPISLLELGLHARGGRLLVGCPPGFHRRGNVRAVCARYG